MYYQFGFYFFNYSEIFPLHFCFDERRSSKALKVEKDLLTTKKTKKHDFSFFLVEKNMFTIKPEESDIEALSSISFTVVFKPVSENNI